MQVGAQVAINGDAFAVDGYTPARPRDRRGTPWSKTQDTRRSRCSSCVARGAHDRPRSASRGDHHAEQPAPGNARRGRGRPLLVRTGSAATFDCNDPVTLACAARPAPRGRASPPTATRCGWSSSTAGSGLDRPDRRPSSRRSCSARGADMAMALDGGSSSTLVLDGTVSSSRATASSARSRTTSR